MRWYTSGFASCRRQVLSLSCGFQRPVLAVLSDIDDGYCCFQRAVLAVLCDIDGGYCCFQRAVLSILSGAGVYLYLFLLLNVVYLLIYVKLGLVVGITEQISHGKKVDILNC